jgi:hypothetical protein
MFRLDKIILVENFLGGSVPISDGIQSDNVNVNTLLEIILKITMLHGFHVASCNHLFA